MMERRTQSFIVQKWMTKAFFPDVVLREGAIHGYAEEHSQSRVVHWSSEVIEESDQKTIIHDGHEAGAHPNRNRQRRKSGRSQQLQCNMERANQTIHGRFMQSTTSENDISVRRSALASQS